MAERINRTEMNFKIAGRPCEICGNSQVEILHHQRFILPENHPLPDNFDIVSCRTCEFVYADTAGTRDAYDRYYGEYSKYADQGTSTGGGGSSADQTRLKETAELI